MKHRQLIVLAAITMIALAPTTQARADMAPPEPPAGGSLDAGEPSTYVQMVSEDVLMTVGDDGADVRATFNMLNMGTEEEMLEVRFPVGYHFRDGAMLLNIDSFAVNVEGKKTDFTVLDEPDEFYLWLTWQVAFPPRETIQVEVSYWAYAQHDFVRSLRIYSYILETGAGWYGSIGEGTVTIRLPYEIGKYNLYSYDPPRPSYYTINGTDIIWQFTNLEPNQKDYISAGILSPPLWKEWQAAEKAVGKNPDSVSAHLQLAHAISTVINYGFEGCWNYCGELGEKAAKEFSLWLNIIPDEYVLRVIPNIVDYHLDYIRLMSFPFYGSESDSVCKGIDRAIALAPTDERVLAVKKEYDWCKVGTPNPTPTLYAPPGCDPKAGRCPPPTATPTTTPRPTSTPRPTRTPTVPPKLTFTLTPTPQPPSPDLTLATLVGIAAVVIGGAGIGVWAARRKARPAGD